MELSKGNISLNFPNTCNEFVIRVINHQIALRDGCRVKGDLYIAVPVHIFIATIHETYLMMRGFVDLNGNISATATPPPASVGIFEPSLITSGGKLRPLSSVIRADLSWLSAAVEAVDKRLEECEATSVDLDPVWLQSLFSTACAAPTSNEALQFSQGIDRPTVENPLKGILPRVVAVPAVRGELPPILRAHFSNANTQQQSAEHSNTTTLTQNSPSASSFPLPSASRFAIMLVRTPYDKSSSKNVKLALFYACSGFAAYIQDVRGRFQSSSGPGPASKYSFYKYVHESNDGLDTVAALSKLSCCNGRVIGNGKSYLAHTQLGVFLGERGYRRGPDDESAPVSRAFEKPLSDSDSDDEEDAEKAKDENPTEMQKMRKWLRGHDIPRDITAADRKLITEECRSASALARAAQDANSPRDAYVSGWRGGFLNMGGFYNAYTSGVRQGGKFMGWHWVSPCSKNRTLHGTELTIMPPFT